MLQYLLQLSPSHNTVLFIINIQQQSENITAQVIIDQ